MNMTLRIQRALHILSTMTQQLVFIIIEHHLSGSTSGCYHLLLACLLLLSQVPIVQAQAELGGAGAFNTSVLGALYGIGLAAVSIERFPVANLTWTSELWARFADLNRGNRSGSRSGSGNERGDVDIKNETSGSDSGTANTPRNIGAKSEVMQLLWFSQGGSSQSWARWSAYDSPYPLFNGLGAHRVTVLCNGPDKPASATGGAWVCVDEPTARAISGSGRALPPQAQFCRGYHYWANGASWWLAVRLKSFTAEVGGRTLNHTGCLEYSGGVDGATAQEGPGHDLPLKVEHLRYTPGMSHYSMIDRPGRVDPEIYPRAQLMMRLLACANRAIISTREADVTLGTIWSFLAPKEGRGGESELDRLVHLESLFECPEPDFFFRINFTRVASSSAIVPHLIEIAITMILPWFGITSLVITEQISRKAIWSSLSTGSSRYVHSSAYGGEMTGQVNNLCTYVTLEGGPTSDLFWLISVFRLLLTLGSYVTAIWAQVALQLNLPTHDDILSTRAARTAGTAAVVVHIATTLMVFTLLRRARPVLVPFFAAVLMTVVVVLEWTNIVSPQIVGPVVLAAEFMSSVVQTMLGAAVAEAVPLEGWRHTASALCVETRVALILAIPRLAAWLQSTAK